MLTFVLKLGHHKITLTRSGRPDENMILMSHVQLTVFVQAKDNTVPRRDCGSLLV